MHARPGIALWIIGLALVANVPLAPAASAEDTARYVVGFTGPLPLVAELYGGRVVDRSDALGFLVVDGIDPADARLDPRVRYVEPDVSQRLIEATPNDPQFSSQYAPQQTRFPLAWDVTMGNTSAAVCVIDSGARLTHQDLAASRYLGGHDFVENDATPQDGDGHGTHVLGIAAASVNNAMNIAGAGNIGYYVARALDDDGAGTWATVAQAIQWCVDRPAARLVISLSLGCGAESTDAAPAHGGGEICDSQPMRDAIANAFAAGRLVVASAGNDGPCYSCVAFPARIPGVLAIGCTGGPDALPCFFTSRGPQVALAAAGYDILSLGHASDTATTTMTGTSMSAPLVAGAAALYWSHDHAIGMSGLRDRIRRSTVDVSDSGWDGLTGCGRLDVKRLFDGTVSTCNMPTFPACDGTPVNDCFANASLLPAEDIKLDLTTSGAGDELDEVHPCEVGRSVWFKFTADRTEKGYVYPSWASAGPSDQGTAAVIYEATGPTIRDLAFVGCSDGFPTPSGPAVVEFMCVAGTTYYLQLGAWGGNVRDINVWIDMCSTGPAAPTVPRNFTAVGGGAIGEVALSWLAPADDGNRTITEYRVERASAPTGVCPSSGFASVETLGGSARSTSDSLAPNQTVCYRLHARNSEGPSPFATAVVFVPGLPDPPRLPGALGGAGEIRLTWQAPLHWGGASVREYRVYAAASASGPFDHVDTIVNESRTWWDRGLAQNTTRWYAVSAHTPLGESAWTKVVSARTAVAPTAPLGLLAEPLLTSPFAIRVSWRGPADAGGVPVTSYELYRDGEPHATIGGTEFVDRSLGAFEHHNYTVRAVNRVGAGAFAAPVCGEAFPWPNAVSRGCP